MRALWAFFAFLILSSCARSTHLGRRAGKQFEKNPVFQKAFSGLVIRDLKTGKVLTNINGDKLFTPASNTKIVTLTAALHFLPDTLPQLVYRIRGDSLIFRGTGNPAFLDERLPWDSVTYHFLAENKNRLFFCGDNFRTTSLGAGWAWDDTSYRYSAPRSPFPIYKNSIRLHFDESTQMWRAEPPYFQDKIQYTPAEGRPQIRLSGGDILITGYDSETREVPFAYSDSLLAALLADTLHREVRWLRQCPDTVGKSVILATVPADSVYAVMMQQSDNLMAEQLLLMTSFQTTGTLSEKDAIEQAKRELPPLKGKNFRWVDGSGLSRYNLFSPMQMTDFILYLLHQYPEERLRNIFPQGQVKGTIKQWYPKYVFAKTGTMSGVHSLTGFMTTRRGHKVVFSFMHNNYLSSSKVYKPEMRKLLEWIYEWF